MKTLIKKSLLVLMLVFVSVFALGLNTKVRAADETLDLTNQGYDNAEEVTTVNGTNFTATFSKGSGSTTPKYYESGTSVRLYAKGTLTISSKSTITKIVFTFGSSDKTNEITANTGTFATDTWVGSANEVVFTVGGTKDHRRFKTITVSLSDSSSELTPSLQILGDSNVMVNNNLTFTEIHQNYEGSSSVLWHSSNEEVATISGGVLTAHSMGTTTISATLDDINSNEITVKVYPSNEKQITIAEARAICDLAGADYSPSYTIQGKIDEIDTPYSDQYKNVSVTISDETGSIQLFRLNGGSELVVGDKVTATGPLTLYGTTYELYAGTYEKVVDESLSTLLANLNAIKSYMSLSYSFTSKTSTGEAGTPITDTLNNALTGVGSGTSYSSWNSKSDQSAAVYAGQSAGDGGTIQLRSTNSNSGIVTTTSGGKVTKIVINWNTTKTTNTSRTVDIYGSNEAYVDPTQLYDTGNQVGELIASAKLSEATDGVSTITIEGDYAYVGLRSKSGALYLDSVEITWSSSSAPITTYDSEFRIKCGVDSSISNLEGIPSGSTFTYGIAVFCGTDVRYYDLATNEFKQEDSKKGISYVVISLGDVLTNKERLEQSFTVRAYVLVNGTDYHYSSESKTYSVVDMVKEYNNSSDADVVNAVASLVEVLTELGKIQ